MAGGVFVGSVYATMRLDTGGFVSDIAKAKSSLGSMAGEFNSGSKSADGFTGSVFKGTFAADALMRGITAVGGMAKDAFGELITLQNARQSFEVLTGSAENASRVMADLATYAKNTPFEFNQIAGASKTLLGFGSTADTVGGQIRKIGDIAGATGGDIGGISLVFGQVQAQGRLMGQDFLQLINNGVALGDVLAKQLGVPASEVKKKIEEGAVTFDVFNAAITEATGVGGKYFGGADKLAQTLSGRISTLKDNFTAMVGTFVGVDFSTGIVQAGGAFDRLSEAVKGVNTWIAANEETINKVAGTIGGAFLTALDAAVAAIGGVVTGIQWWVKGFQQGNPLIIIATGLIGGLVATFIVWKTVMFATFIVWKTVMFAITTATKAYAAAQVLLNIAMSANPIGIIIGLVVGLIAGIVLLYQNSETFRNIVTGAFNFVLGAIQGAWNWIKSNWPMLLAILTGPIGIAVLLITQNWDTIKNAFASAWQFIQGVWGGVVGWFAGIGNGIRNTFNNAVEGAKSMFNGLVSFVRGIPGSIMGAIGGMGSLLYNSGRDLLNGLVNGAKSILGNIGKFFLDAVPGWIKEPFKKALGINSPSRVFMGYGKNIGEAVPMGVASQMGSIKQSMYDMANVVTSSFNPDISSGLGNFNAIGTGSGTMGGSSSSVQMYGNINIASDVDGDRFLTNAGLMREGQLVEKGMAI